MDLGLRGHAAVLLATPAAGHVTGQVVTVDGGRAVASR